jgi:hypothetical protein
MAAALPGVSACRDLAVGNQDATIYMLPGGSGAFAPSAVRPGVIAFQQLLPNSASTRLYAAAADPALSALTVSNQTLQLLNGVRGLLPGPMANVVSILEAASTTMAHCHHLATCWQTLKYGYLTSWLVSIWMACSPV